MDGDLLLLHRESRTLAPETEMEDDRSVDAMKKKNKKKPQPFVLSVACPTCGAAVGAWCKNEDGSKREFHPDRLVAVPPRTPKEAA
jgi:hypothetical protein